MKVDTQQQNWADWFTQLLSDIVGWFSGLFSGWSEEAEVATNEVTLAAQKELEQAREELEAMKKTLLELRDAELAKAAAQGAALAGDLSALGATLMQLEKQATNFAQGLASDMTKQRPAAYLTSMFDTLGEQGLSKGALTFLKRQITSNIAYQKMAERAGIDLPKKFDTLIASAPVSPALESAALSEAVTRQTYAIESVVNVHGPNKSTYVHFTAHESFEGSLTNDEKYALSNFLGIIAEELSTQPVANLETGLNLTNIRIPEGVTKATLQDGALLVTLPQNRAVSIPLNSIDLSHLDTLNTVVKRYWPIERCTLFEQRRGKRPCVWRSWLRYLASA
jgi:hypothetical protein